MSVTHAYTFPNGMLMVFDDSGQQVTKYQGKTEDMIPKLIADWPDCAIIRHDQPFEITLKPAISKVTELEQEISKLRAKLESRAGTQIIIDLTGQEDEAQRVYNAVEKLLYDMGQIGTLVLHHHHGEADE